jgi:light-regulated signal transduction histidine kinase (bacteriophytochrome)
MIECTIEQKNGGVQGSSGEPLVITGLRIPGGDPEHNELEALSYSISHDLRGPLTAIRNIGEWLSEQNAATLDTEGRTMIARIIASSVQMEKLLDGLLAFSRVVRLSPRRSLIDMTSLVGAVIDELLEREDNPSSLAITLRPLPAAYGDTTLIRQVWNNLLTNAFKFTRYRRRREVEIGSYRCGEDAVYCVGDNGAGFDMQYADGLFKAFHRLHAGEEFEGTGVGLAIVRRIIQRHNGRVWAEGKEDNGARFYFTLPNTQE